jgi:hypothetical protein
MKPAAPVLAQYAAHGAATKNLVVRIRLGGPIPAVVVVENTFLVAVVAAAAAAVVVVVVVVLGVVVVALSVPLLTVGTHCIGCWSRKAWASAYATLPRVHGCLA